MENKNTCVLSEEQTSFLEENFGKLPEKELVQKLSEIGPALDDNSFKEVIRTFVCGKEGTVFRQDVSAEELDSLSAGSDDCLGIIQTRDWDCVKGDKRDIYKNGFPNCAATVEDGSWCWTNDACYDAAVVYKGMKECHWAWR